MATSPKSKDSKELLERLETEVRLAELRASLAEAQLRLHRARHELQEINKAK